MRVSSLVGRAAVITSYGAPLEVREYPVFEPDPDGLLVEVEVATLCGSDVHLWEGAFSGQYQPPLVPGHEAVGRIVAFGAGPRVDSTGTPLAIGDRVVWEHGPCQRCYQCTVLRQTNLCRNRLVGMLINADEAPHTGGNLAQYSYVWPRSGRVRVPDSVDSVWASGASCAMRTVVRAMERLGSLDFTNTVVIQGAGPLGLYATALAASQSPRKIIVIGGPRERLAIAEAYGATHTILFDDHPDPAGLLDAVRTVAGPNGPDVVIEVSGGRDALSQGIEMAADGGRYVVVGSVFGPPQLVTASQVVMKDLTIVGSFSAEIGSYYKALQFLEEHRDRFDWDLMFGPNRYSLDDATIAFARMQSYQETKPVFRIA